MPYQFGVNRWLFPSEVARGGKERRRSVRNTGPRSLAVRVEDGKEGVRGGGV